MDAELIVRIVVTLVAFILSCTVHEWAHAFMATRLGDPTPRGDGRLTLNPSVHIDPVGTLLFPAIGAISGFAMIGWGKPVDYRPHLFRRDVNMRTGALMVAFAGPVANLLLALICTLLLPLSLMLGHAVPSAAATVDAFGQFIVFGITANCVLAVVNLLPLPPLDGYRILSTLLGDHPVVAFIEQYALVLSIVVLLSSQWVIGIPAGFLNALFFGLIT